MLFIMIHIKVIHLFVTSSNENVNKFKKKKKKKKKKIQHLSKDNIQKVINNKQY